MIESLCLIEQAAQHHPDRTAAGVSHQLPHRPTVGAESCPVSSIRADLDNEPAGGDALYISDMVKVLSQHAACASIKAGFMPPPTQPSVSPLPLLSVPLLAVLPLIVGVRTCTSLRDTY